MYKTLQEQDLNTPVKKVWTTSQDLHSIQLTPTVSTLRPLLEQQTPGAVVYSDKTSLHCEPWQPQLSCVSPWIRQCTANSKLVWPWQWSPQIRQCNANSELASNSQNKLHVLCQPLDKAVYCKLQVSMTRTLEHSDKAVTANSELAFSVEKTRTLKVNQPEDQCTHNTPLNVWSNGHLLVCSYGKWHPRTRTSK